MKRTKQAKNKRKIILIQLPDPDLPKLTMFEAHTHHTGKLKSKYSPKSPWTLLRQISPNVPFLSVSFCPFAWGDPPIGITTQQGFLFTLFSESLLFE